MTLGGVSAAEQSRLLEHLKKLVLDLLHGTAEQEVIAAHAKALQVYLLGQGYVRTAVELTTTRMGNYGTELVYKVTVNAKKRYLFLGNKFFTSDFLMQELFLTESQGISIPEDMLIEDIEALYKKRAFIQSKPS